jgi:hypothetical protein
MRSRTGISAGRRLAGWLGAVTVLLAAAGVLVAAGPARADSGPVAGLRMHFATAAPQVTAKTVQASYSCDFSGYGSGIAPATVAAAYAVPDSWPVNNPAVVALATDTLALPSQVTSQLGGVDSFQVLTTVQAQHATAATTTVTGDTTGTTLPTPVTQVPQILSVGQVTFPAKGTGTVKLPPATMTITPFAGSTGKPNIICTTTTTAQNVSITVGNATGSFYKCTLTVAGESALTQSGTVNMTVTALGKRTVGATDTVTLSSSDIATNLVGLSDLPSSIKADFSGSLPVTGAQSGSVKLTGTGSGGSSGPLKATGKLHLSKAGTIHLLLPQTFTITVTGQGVSAKVSCTLQTSPAPTALTMSVAKASTSPGSGTHNGSSGSTQATSENSSTTTTGTGTPVGAPATGGGLGLMSGDTPAMAGASAALMAAGGALLLWARRRRTGEQLAGGLWRSQRRRSP